MKRASCIAAATTMCCLSVWMMKPVEAGSVGGSVALKGSAPIRQTIESSKLVHLTLYSKALNKRMGINVYLPPGYDKSKRYPVLYMMHAYTCNENTWFSSHLRLNTVASQLIQTKKIQPLIIVSPEMDNSFGLDSAQNVTVTSGDKVTAWYKGMYETYFIKEVLGYVDSHFPTITSSKGRYIGGNSMGGFIALHMAFKYPNLFSKVSGDSPAISNKYERANFPFADEDTRPKWDPIYLAEEQNLKSLRVYLDCGLEDEYGFYDPVKSLYQTLKARGVNVQMYLAPGNHSWKYWSQHVAEYLEFFAG